MRTHCEHATPIEKECRVCNGEFGTIDFYIAPSATPNRTAARRQPYRPVKQPSWEAGVAGERRGDKFVPYLNEHGSPIGIKKYAENRRQIDDRVKRLKNDPGVFSNTP